MTTSYPTGTNSASDSSENSTKVATSFDIRDHLDKLTPGKEKDRYICPVCGSHNLGINSKDGKYKCFDSECDKADIREAIKPWAEVVAEREAEKNKSGSQKPKKKVVTVQKAIPLKVTAPIPTGLKLLKLPAPQQGPEPQKPKFFPKDVPASALQINYSYSPTQEVSRWQWLDPNSPKGRAKTYRQNHIDGDGKQVWTKGDLPWPAYRLDEVVETLAGIPENEPVAVLMLEGEPNVELARSHGIAGLTMQGSQWSDIEITRTLEALRATGKNITLVNLRDNDISGIGKGSQVQSSCDKMQFPCIIIDPVAIHPDIPDKGDIREILENMDIEEFIQRLEAEIHAAATEEINDNSLTPPPRPHARGCSTFVGV